MIMVQVIRVSLRRVSRLCVCFLAYLFGTAQGVQQGAEEMARGDTRMPQGNGFFLTPAAWGDSLAISNRAERTVWLHLVGLAIVPVVDACSLFLSSHPLLHVFFLSPRIPLSPGSDFGVARLALILMTSLRRDGFSCPFPRIARSVLLIRFLCLSKLAGFSLTELSPNLSPVRHGLINSSRP